jgi:hypothetical protein
VVELSSPGAWCRALLDDVLPPHNKEFNSSWRTPDVLELAQHVYDNRDTSVIPVLGDALEEAGCDWPELLDHCRAHLRHARGCWVVDAVLGKS